MTPTNFFLKVIFVTIILSSTILYSQTRNAPIMGWSSWNNFRVHIDEKIIKEQADAMISSGLYEAGYRFINIDDGYFGGRDKSGRLYCDSIKFPSGMKSLADYIHSKKLKAGIYTDAGRNTCGSIYDKDQKGIGVGIYGYLEEDCETFFDDWKYDFLKVDWCGGEKMNLDEKTEYLKIINEVKSKGDIVFNVCRWKFPGQWVLTKADSWRISSDIRAEFSSILKIIDINADLYQYSKPGHYNDMDMLQVGRGMTIEEDKSHFSMWCILNSPLLAGNDLRKMSQQTIGILTNKEVIALNQDAGFHQGKRIYKSGDIEVWIKSLGNASTSYAIAILNRGTASDFELKSELLKLSSDLKIRDLWAHKDLGKIGKTKKFRIPEHGVILLRTN
ncbi:glycoside hydrolase family 27 protein [Flavobacterium aquidurense]|uniref:glycoside hydrolase family 27 protein n=1 Tax=Flavobacterium aquidurense TaxID=362413 RepID=UPI0037143740